MGKALDVGQLVRILSETPFLRILQRPVEAGLPEIFLMCNIRKWIWKILYVFKKTCESGFTESKSREKRRDWAGMVVAF
jgi:hypothetical protein